MTKMRRKLPWTLRLRGGPYSRGWVGFPTVLVTVGWIALWLLWPTAQPVPRPVRIASSARIEHSPLPSAWRHAGPPSVFVEPWFPTPSGSDEAVPTLSAFLPRAERPVMLEREPEPIVMPPSLAAGVAQPFASRLASLPETQVRFPAPPDAMPTVACEISPVLEGWGFAVPADALTAVKQAAGVGTVALHVALDRDGWPEHVFVEESSGDQRFDAIVAQAVYRGRTERRPDTPAAGRVVIIKKGTP